MKHFYSFRLIILMLYNALSHGASSIESNDLSHFSPVKSLKTLAEAAVIKELQRNPQSSLFEDVFSLSDEIELPLMRTMINKGIVRRLGTWMLTRTLPGAESLSFSPDGKKLAAVAGNNFYLWDLQPGELLTLHSYANKYLSGTVSYNPKEERMVAAWQNDRNIYTVDLKCGEEKKYRGSSCIPIGLGLKEIVYSPDGTRLLCVFSTGTVWLFDSDGHFIRDFYIPAGETKINSAHFSPDGSRIVFAIDYRNVYINDVHTGHVLTMLDGHGRHNIVYKAIFDASGDFILSLGANEGEYYGTMCLWNSHTGAHIKTIPSIEIKYVKTTDISREGLIALCGVIHIKTRGRIKQKRALILTDIETNTRQAIIPTDLSDGVRIIQLLFSPNGSSLAVAKQPSRTVEIWSDYAYMLTDLEASEIRCLYLYARLWLANKAVKSKDVESDPIHKELKLKCALLHYRQFKKRLFA